MAQNFIACDREQPFLLPPDVRDWVPEDHLAWFVIDTVGVMDLAARLRAGGRRVTVGAGMTQLRVHMLGLQDSDDEERAELTSRLREEMLEEGVEEVAHPDAQAPNGAKGGALEWAQLVVGLAGSIGPLLSAMRGWLGRHPDAGITLEIDGDRLTLDAASPADRERLVEAFLAHHGAG